MTTVRDVIKRAIRMGGNIASGLDPGPDDLTDGLTALNAMKRAMFGTQIGPRLSPIPATGALMQAESGGEYQIPAARMILVAPFNPRPGARFGVVDAQFNFATNTCTVDGNGRLLEGSTATINLTANGAARRWWFRSDTGDWVREADYATADDDIGFPPALAGYLSYMLNVALAAEFDTEMRPDVVAMASEGRAAFARTYSRRSRNIPDPPIGVGQAKG